MSFSIIQRIDEKISKYQEEYKGQMPLYLIVSTEDADALYGEIRRMDGHSVDVLVTSYKDIKVVTHDSLNAGEVRLTNELPETGS